jgi:adenylate cyclase
MAGGTVEAALRRAESEGLRLNLEIRLAALALLATWLVYSHPLARALPALALLGGFAVLGAMPLLLGRRFGRPLVWAGLFAACDVALLTAAALLPNPLDPTGWPVQMRARFSTVLYPFVYVAGTALSHAPGLVLWTGGLAALAWSLGHRAIAAAPGSIVTDGTRLVDEPGLSATGALELYLDPRYVSVAAGQTQTVALLPAAP